ncbi:WD40 repeat domain-containing protein [Nonomuraea sp. NPDC050547]|uniref:WD40 repeat domain-containing protein n=1 Tax=Nonomuraea sp. NPDC050547 TaxID=3364368 RepID=UPI0037ABF6C2
MNRTMRAVAALLLLVLFPAAGAAAHRSCTRPAPPLTALTGHLDITQVLIGSLDGRKIVISAGSEGTVRVWDAATLRPAGVPMPGRAPIAYASPYLLITDGAQDGGVRTVDLRRPALTGPTVEVSLHEDRPRLVVGELDGTAVTTGGGDEIGLFDLATGRPVGTALPTGGSPVAILSLDGVPVMIVEAEAELVVWNLRTREKLGRTLALRSRPEPPNTMAAEVTTIDGRPSVLLPTHDRGVLAWDLLSREWRTAVDVTEALKGDSSAMATHRGTSVLLRLEEQPGAGEDLDLDGHEDRSRITAWDPVRGTGRTFFDVPGHVTTLAAEGSLVVTGGADNALRSFDLDTGRAVAVAHGSSADRMTRLVPAGHLAVTIRDVGGWQVVDPATGESVGEPVSPDAGVRAIAADATTVVTGGGAFSPVVRVWDLRTRRERGRPLHGFSSHVGQVALSDELIIAAGDGGKRDTVRFWDRAGRVAHPALRLPGRLRDLGVARLHGKPVALAMSRSAIWVIDLATGTRTGSLAFGPRQGYDGPGELGSMVVGSVGCVPIAVFELDGTGLVINLATGRPLRAPFDLKAESQWIELGLSGGLLTVADRETRMVHAVFDIMTGQLLAAPWV